MQARIDHQRAAPAVLQAMLKLQGYVDECGLEHSLLELVKMRASQLNGCAYCLDMHSKDARAAGETEQRLYLLDAWREAPFYSERERAALAWTEAVTFVAEGYVPDEVYQQARAQFSEEELVKLTLAVVTINGWNRFNVAFKAVPGAYRPRSRASRASVRPRLCCIGTPRAAPHPRPAEECPGGVRPISAVFSLSPCAEVYPQCQMHCVAGEVWDMCCKRL